VKTCKHCAKSKARQKNVWKESVAPKLDVPGHRLYLDPSKVTVKSGTLENMTVNCDNSKVMVCKAIGKTWSDFTVTKSDMVKHTCEHLHKIKSQGIPVWYVHWTQWEKIKLLAKGTGSSDWAVVRPIDCEFTSCNTNTPQHNDLAELAFPYLAGKACVMMGGGNST
jgi:hypothetical protein